MGNRIDTTILDDIIVGRVEPHIYAFSTETVPNYLKVGDTARGVRVRLDEWRKIYPNLVKRYEHSAQIDAETIFRDYAVHTFLEWEKGRKRLQPHDIKGLPYYSNEFFEQATTADLSEAISDIHRSAREKDGKYPFYSPDHLPQTFTYERNESYRPRQNQQEVIDNFKAAIAAGRKNLLLYAVMRFGKSFTAMCCAKEMDAKLVAIVSAKADVKEEWKKTVESHVYFKNYTFLDSYALQRNETVVAQTLATGGKVALFLTLQDLQGEKIKTKHHEVFEHQIDLLIIDETHFGVRAASYGKVLQEQNLSKAEMAKELKAVDGFETLDQVEKAVKSLDARIRIHLSGTPYRILMGDEFQREDIIAFVQFSDIIDAQKQWDNEHLKEDDCEEWVNPYYGFPQLIRFAFNPNVSSIRKIEELRKNGITHAFAELFRPHSMVPKEDDSHSHFIHEAEVLDLLEVIDGAKEDENLLGFLDYDKIKEGKMCRHMVMVLPFRASCDAMAALIHKEKKRFTNLGEYEIINIAGHDDIKRYKTTDEVKRTIKTCEEKGIKTLTLTVNRMLTGTTVPQWDTMIYLKGTSSPQEYDQAIFRLQNQYVTTFKDKSGKTVKYNMKPQTLLVDFDPNRMFRLQELKSQLYNVNTEVQGNARLKERIAKELEISPIIVQNKNKLQKVEPTNITDIAREYSRNRSIRDDASELPTDSNLLDDAEILNVIQGLAPIDAKKGLQIKPAEDEGIDIDIPDTPPAEANENKGQQGNDNQPQKQEDEESKDLDKKLAAYYARILFFAFLTESTVKSLEDMIASIPATEDNQRIAKNLGLNTNILKAIQQKSNPFILQKLDYKIENTNDLVRDDQLKPIERAEVAMHKFGRLSDSEIVTPAKVADEMVALLPFDELTQKKDTKFLDIASKQGEFSIAIYKRFGKNVKGRIYAIPTSPLAYEFTRKVYTLLGMPVENVFSKFTSYDLIGNNKEQIIKQLRDMNFNVIIANPPYQNNQATQNCSINRAFSSAIYPHFIDVSRLLASHYISLITPSRWMTKTGQGIDGKWVDEMINSNQFITIHDFYDALKCFPNVEIKGGVSYFLLSPKYNGPCDFVMHGSSYTDTTKGQLNKLGAGIIIKDSVAASVYKKTRAVEERNSCNSDFSELVGPQHFFDKNGLLTTSWKGYSPTQDSEHTIKYYLNKQIESQGFAWIKRSDIPKNTNVIPLHKVYLSKAFNGGDSFPHQIIGCPFYGEPNSVCSQTYLVIGYNQDKRQLSQESCENIVKYIKTRFFRFLVFIKKKTQDNPSSVFQFVPLQDFTSNSDIDWSKSVPEIDQQLYVKYGLSEDEITFIESMIKPM